MYSDGGQLSLAFRRTIPGGRAQPLLNVGAKSLAEVYKFWWTHP